MGTQYTAPYVNFQGRAREAMEFYHQILGGQLSLFAFDFERQGQVGGRVGSNRLRSARGRRVSCLRLRREP